MNKLPFIALVALLLTACARKETTSYTYVHSISYTNAQGVTRTVKESCTTGYRSTCYKTEGPRPDVGDYICDANGRLYLHPRGEGTNMREGLPLLQEGLTCTTGFIAYIKRD